MSRVYQVKECFGPTIQGEGPHQGQPCVFLRFAGCNAWDGRPETRANSACPYCDTDFRGGEAYTIDDICQRLLQLRGEVRRLGLVISGGEPLLQVDSPLLFRLDKLFHWIDIETNGTRPTPWPMPAKVSVICSPKAIVAQPIVVEPDAWKILIPAQEAFLEQAIGGSAPVFVQPVCPDNGPSGASYDANLQRCLDLCYRHGCRLSLQLHKYLGVP
ncbi:MAG: 7-carboxy-7-deazaguanine synthase [Planctomycetota bacterium]|nr:MAG: 7-carboxy-7-deazaguanine synthase [Planctomycetota bacterium]